MEISLAIWEMGKWAGIVAEVVEKVSGVGKGVPEAKDGGKAGGGGGSEGALQDRGVIGDDQAGAEKSEEGGEERKLKGVVGGGHSGGAIKTSRDDLITRKIMPRHGICLVSSHWDTEIIGMRNY